MPEPLLYMQSLGAATLVGALSVLAVAGRRGASCVQLNAACVLGGCLGMAAGCWLLRWQLVWPPASALDRVVTIIIPAGLSVELVAAGPWIRPAFGWALRGIFIGAAPLILLHRSIYLAGFSTGWTNLQACGLVLICSACLAALWI